ncbi:FAD dependent oxidoreductase [Phaeosphaeriaceae sp. SRC1lsM3a]|nr:FAD dependent oxidoreductase [Stagonospora sp. SRC1lsM3a]
MANTKETPQSIAVLGAGVIGLTSALVLANAYPDAKITVIAKHFPGDRSIEYTSPWAGANWSSMAHDNGRLEKYDEVTFNRFGQLIDGEDVWGCKAIKKGEGNEVGLGRQGMWGIFDSPIEETGILSDGTNKIWYDKLVGGLRFLSKEELPHDANFGLEFPQSFRINTAVYLTWLQNQALSKGIKPIRRHYASLSSLLTDLPSTTLVINATGIGSLFLDDIRDKNMYPTRGQTFLVAEPKKPITRMYEFERLNKYGSKLQCAIGTWLTYVISRYVRSPKRIDPTATYIFPRPLQGGVILGGSRDDNNWSDEWDEQLGKEIMERCCTLCPELGRPEDLQVISRNIGLRPSRKGGPRVEVEKGTWKVPVVHAYGHSGAGYQASW